MNTKTIKIPNISCDHCVATIKREVGEIKGVESVEGDPLAKTVTIAWSDPADWKVIADTLQDIGYPARG